MHTLYLKTKDPYSPFSTALRQTLSSANIQLVDNQQDAATTLNIINVHFKYYTPTLGNSNLARTYTFHGHVIFEITNTKGDVLLKPQTLSSTRSLTLNANQLLGTNNQATQLKQEMIREMINKLFNRLSSEQVRLALEPTHKTIPSNHKP